MAPLDQTDRDALRVLPFSQLIDAFADRVAERLASRLQARSGSVPTSGMISQRDSVLGKKTHCAFVRRGLAEGLDGFGKIGRQWLASPERISEELARLGRDAVPTAEADPAQELRRELAAIRAGVGQ